jgi:hypothetical protein
LEAIVVRRIVEEDVAAPTSTVVHDDDGSWIGRTIVTLVILALLVVGAIWLVRSLSDGNGANVNINDNRGQQSGQVQNPDDTQPSNVLPS